MTAAQSAAMRKKDPADGPLQCVLGAHAAEVDRAAMRTARGEHQPTSSAAGDFEAPGRTKREVRSGGRLASRAALICSGVLKSGSETCTRCRARDTWRLCRLANLLSIPFSFPNSTHRRRSSKLQEIFEAASPFLPAGGIRRARSARNRRRSTSFFPTPNSAALER
jgi:hypothetical protein